MAAADLQIIAHRGASGYLPEHSLAGKALAFAMGADFLEQDVVCTADGEAIVFHDPWLDATTDVARKFPDRARDDGRYWVVDFTLAEIRTLAAGERRDPATGVPTFPDRFPAGLNLFQVVTLREEIQFVLGLNGATERAVGIYPEIKHPGWHRDHGIDISKVVLDVLASELKGQPELPLWLQCFDSDELQRLKNELNCPWPLVQLLDSRESTPAMQEVARYADAIGPSVSSLLEEDGRLPKQAFDAGLKEIHAWTLRRDRLPDSFSSLDELLDLSLAAGATGIFTDFPDLVYTWRQNS